ncbi:MAG TPA: hypothetical protein VGR37_21775 [Longimicrobiaceae bacterium]|nr:hypothetical protein [Longimicrobiaceae bacterium]
MDDETVRAIAELAVKFSNIYTGVVVLIRIFAWVAAMIIAVDLMNLFWAAVGRRILAYHQLMKPMADQMGYDHLFYTDWELEQIFRVFMRGLEAERAGLKVDETGEVGGRAIPLF